MRVAVFGAREGSLGEAVANLLRFPGDNHEVTTFGAHGEDVVFIWPDVRTLATQRLIAEQFDAIVCTIGVNQPTTLGHSNFDEAMADSYGINVLAPMRILEVALGFQQNLQAFVAVSSNSANIARRGSMAYCASKAALSMAIRCAARDLADGSGYGVAAEPPLVYGYEFGLLAGTPMTKGTEKQFGPSQTRIPGHPQGLSADRAALAIVRNLTHPWEGLNGALLRLDGGEQ